MKKIDIAAALKPLNVAQSDLQTAKEQFEAAQKGYGKTLYQLNADLLEKVGSGMTTGNPFWDDLIKYQVTGTNHDMAIKLIDFNKKVKSHIGELILIIVSHLVPHSSNPRNEHDYHWEYAFSLGTIQGEIVVRSASPEGKSFEMIIPTNHYIEYGSKKALSLQELPITLCLSTMLSFEQATVFDLENYLMDEAGGDSRRLQVFFGDDIFVENARIMLYSSQGKENLAEALKLLGQK